MQYDNYEKKIKKITRVLKLLFRHKVEIALTILAVIVGSALMTAAVSAFVAVQGTIISDDTSYESEIFYGDDLDYYANALLCKVGYEYAAKGSDEWSEEFPLDPGDYRVRAVANAMVGRRYGEERSFTVKPKQITVEISGNTVIYGNGPTLVSSDLVYGDVISGAEFIYNDVRTEAEPIADTVIISDAEGNDISARYVVKTEMAEITTTQRPVTLTVGNISKMYDGTPLTVSEENVVFGEYGFAEGDVPQLTLEGTVTNVGHTNGYVSCRVYNGAGEDVTDWYKVTTVSGKVEVTPRVITLRSHSFDRPKMYTGESYSMQICDIVGSVQLVEGDRLVTSGWRSIKDAGEKENRFTCYIENDDPESRVNSNYEIIYEYGTLTVLPRPITVTTGSLSGIKYDGRGHSNELFTISGEYGLVDGHIATNSGILPAVVYAGEANKVENKFAIRITNDGATVTHNYDITYVYGTLMLDKRPITVTAQSNENILYSGMPQPHPLVSIGGDGLADGDMYICDTYTEKTDAGTYDNKVTVDIRSSAGRGASVRDSYDITYEDGTIVIKPRRVTITPDGLTAMYDGEAKINVSYSWGGDGFAYGHSLDVTESTAVTNVESKFNVFTKYSVVDGNGELISPDNYVITFNEGGLITVYQRPIVIGSGNKTFTYNDESFGFDNVFVYGKGIEGSNGLVKDHVLTGLHAIGEGIDVNVYTNTIIGKENIDIVDGNGNSVLRNYAIARYVEGDIIIERRPIAVIFGSLNEYYNGMYQYSDSIAVNNDVSGNMGLCAGHVFGFDLADVPKYQDVTSGKINYFDFTILKNGADVSSNYDTIDIQEGTLTIRRRPLTIKTYGYDGVYDGMYHSNATVDVIPTNGVGGLCVVTVGGEEKYHTIRVITVLQFKDVVSDGRNAIFYEILNENGEFISENGANITQNYEITEDIGLFNITKRKVIISTPVYSEVYNGTANQQFVLNIEPTTKDSGLCIIPTDDPEVFLTHKVVPFTDLGSPLKNVDETENVVIFKIVDEKGNTVWEDGEGNYDAQITYGTVSIAKRKVYVASESMSWIYDGYNHTHGVINVILGFEDGYDFVEGHSWFVIESELPFVKHVKDGNVTNEFDVYVMDQDSEEVTPNYDVIIVEKGIINITPRPITITSENADKPYDAEPLVKNEFKVIEGDLVLNDQIFAETTGTQTDIGSSPNTYDQTAFKIVCGEEDVTESYAITFKEGTLTVTATLVFRPIDVEKKYDGTPLRPDEVEGNLVWDIYYEKGYRIIKVICGGEQTIEGEGESYIVELVIGDAEGNVAFTYKEGEGYQCIDPELRVDEFLTEYGILKVTPADTRIIEIYVFSSNTTYDGKNHSIDVNNWMLIPGFELEEGGAFNILGLNISLTNAGKITAFDINNDCALKPEEREHWFINYIYTVNGYDFTRYCQIVLVNIASPDEDYDVLTVNKRKITLTAGSATAEYFEGATLTYDHYEMTKGSLAEGHTILEVVIEGSIDYVGTVNNVIDRESVDIFNENNESVKENYAITYVDGTLTFTDTKID